METSKLPEADETDLDDSPDEEEHSSTDEYVEEEEETGGDSTNKENSSEGDLSEDEPQKIVESDTNSPVPDAQPVTLSPQEREESTNETESR